MIMRAVQLRNKVVSAPLLSFIHVSDFPALARVMGWHLGFDHFGDYPTKADVDLIEKKYQEYLNQY